MERKEIEFRNIGKSFHGRRILSGISFEIEKGETVGLIGESGIGKTTLLRIAAGLEQPDEGALYLHGVKTESRVPPNLRDAAVVFQEPVLWNHMTVKGNIRYAMGGAERKVRDGGRLEGAGGIMRQGGIFGIADRKARAERIREIADSLGIGDLLSRYPSQISGGQAKRVSLARAFASDKSIFLLDEPLSNLDDGTKGAVLELIKKEYAGRKTILYITHDTEEARSVCDRILCLGREGVQDEGQG